MRRQNPLSEILEAALREEEPRFDTEWPADDTALLLPKSPPLSQRPEHAPRPILAPAR